MFRNIINEYDSYFLFLYMDQTTIIIIGIAALTVGITALSIYTAFGPPSVSLDDPFEDHED